MSHTDHSQKNVSVSTASEEKDRASLASVLRACADGERGYRAAAKDVADPGFALMFEHYADERAGFAHALRDAAHAPNGSRPRGSTKGALHRSWIDARSKLTHGGARGLLAECARGEQAALDAYRDALKANLAPGLRELMQEQYESIKKAHEELTFVLDAEER